MSENDQVTALNLPPLSPLPEKTQKYFDIYPQHKLQFELSPKNDWDDIPTLAMVKRFKGFGFEIS